MKKVHVYVENPTNTNGLTIYEIEETLNEEEKLKIIDEMRDGIGNYLYEIIKKWEAEKDSLPKDQYGRPKTVSVKAWIKRNDPDDKAKITTDYIEKLGHYWLFGTEYKGLSTICPTTRHGYGLQYSGKGVINQWFHDLCVELHKEEKKYFQAHDPVELKLTKVRKYGHQYPAFCENKDINDVIWNGKKDVTEEWLDAVIKAYEELKKNTAEVYSKLNSKLNKITI